MGVKGFQSWFKETYVESYVPLKGVVVDHMYVDVNSLLHNALRQAKSWEDFHKLLHLRLDSLIRTCPPRKSIMLAVDGPGPVAKLLLQRERRKKRRSQEPSGSKEPRSGQVPDDGSGTSEDEGESTPDSESDTETDSVLTGNALTPGTTFMLDVSTSLKAWAAAKLERMQHIAIEVSDATVPGEGEVKILGRLANHWHPVCKEDTHAIFGDDSDLLLMAMASKVPRLLVLRGSPTGWQRTPIGSVCSVDEVHAALAKELQQDVSILLGKGEMQLMLGLKLDLLLVSVITRGNDYLPPLFAQAGTRLWKRHMQMWRAWCEHGGGGVAAGSDAAAGDIYAQPLVCGPGIVRPGTTPGGLPSVSVRALGALLHAAGAARYQAVVKKPKSAEDALKAPRSAPEYLHGLTWLVQMYLQGECPDYRYCYDAHAPAPADMLQLCTKLTLQATETDPSRCVPVALTDFYNDRGVLFDEPLDHAPLKQRPEAAPQPMLPVASALAMLPQASKSLLPQPAQRLMAAGSPLESLFFECQECAALKGRASAMGRAVGVCRLQMNAIQDALSGAESASSEAGTGADDDEPSGQPGSAAELSAELSAEPSAEPSAGLSSELQDLSSTLEAAVEAVAQAREQVRAANQDYASHVVAAHPYAPFPVAAIVSAVEGLPHDAFSTPELKLMRFGRSTLLAAPGWEPPPGMGQRVQPQAPPPPPRRRSKQAPPVQMFAIVGPDGGRGAGGDAVEPLLAPHNRVCLTREEDPPLDAYLTCGPDTGSEGVAATTGPSGSAPGRGRGRGRGRGDGRGGRQGRGRGRSEPTRSGRGGGRGQGRGNNSTDQGGGPAPKQSALMADAAAGGQEAGGGSPAQAELLAAGGPAVLGRGRGGKPGQGRGRGGARQRDQASPEGGMSVPAGPDAALVHGGSAGGGDGLQRQPWPGPGQGRGNSWGTGPGDAINDSGAGRHRAAAVRACAPAPGAAAAIARYALRRGAPAGYGRLCGGRPLTHAVRAAARPPVRAVVSRPGVLLCV